MLQNNGKCYKYLFFFNKDHYFQQTKKQKTPQSTCLLIAFFISEKVQSSPDKYNEEGRIFITEKSQL